MIRSALVVLALAFALAHLPYLPSTLEDIDSVNFALGIRDFDVAQHRPHPPGYPVYIGLGKVGVTIARVFAGDALPSSIEARALAAISLIGGVAAIVLMYRVLASLPPAADAPLTSSDNGALITPPWRQLDPRALAATALTAACPLFWYLSARPMSDVPGLAAALASQACLALAWWRQQPTALGDRRLTADRMGASGRMIVLGALLAGVAIGFRSQNAILTLPLLLAVLFDRIGRGVAGAMLGVVVAFSVGVLAWGVPLVVASGGLNGYLAALGTQAGEDFAGVEMLYSHPSPRLLGLGLLRTLIHPWESLVLGGVVITLAALGAAALLLREGRTFTVVSIIALPYLVFHLLFHDTTFIRYALPLVPVVAFLAVRGAELVARRAALLLVGAVALWAVSIASPVLVAYASDSSPTMRALEEIDREPAGTRPDVLAMHQTFRRPLEAETVPVGTWLASPPRREWLELSKYWRAGHTAPLWFLADPRRSDLSLIDPRSRADRLDFAWSWTSLSELGGMRPSAVHLYRMPAPGWFADEGWALTPETAGIARLMGRGPSLAPITAWVRRRPGLVHVMVGGRHFGGAGDPPVRFVVAVDGQDIHQWDATPGFFVQEFDIAAGVLAGNGFAALTIRSISSQGGTAFTAIEQFDVQSAGTLMWAYETDWHEAEFNQTLGVWRWTSDKSTLRIVSATTPIVVALRVERPRRYFDGDPTVRLSAVGEVLGETSFRDGNLWTVTVPLEILQRSSGRLTIETNRTFVPAERDGVPDRRRLGLRVFDINVTAQH